MKERKEKERREREKDGGVQSLLRCPSKPFCPSVGEIMKPRRLPDATDAAFPACSSAAIAPSMCETLAEIAPQ